MLPKGSIIVCPTCKTKLAKSNIDLRSGDARASKYWENIYPNAVYGGASMVCPIDDTYYFSLTSGELHTTKGCVRIGE